jgi:hypothetical protein
MRWRRITSWGWQAHWETHYLALEPEHRRLRAHARRGSRDIPANSGTRGALSGGLTWDTDSVDIPLWALDDARTDASAELRDVLLQEHEGRVRDGLV